MSNKTEKTMQYAKYTAIAALSLFKTILLMNRATKNGVMRAFYFGK